MSQNNKIDNQSADLTAGELLKFATTMKGTISNAGAVKATTVRIQLPEYCKIEAISELADMPRNKIIQLLIESGLEAYQADLDSSEYNRKTLKKFNELFRKFLSESLNEPNTEFEKDI